MKLCILRHGEAEPQAGSDAERRLTPRGRAGVRAVAEAAAVRLAGLQAVACSPYQRTRQTAAEFMRALHFGGDFAVEPALAPGARIGGVVAFAEHSGFETLLLVSHQPLVGDLLGYLTDDAGLAPMAPAHLVALEVTALVRGGARLLWREQPPE